MSATQRQRERHQPHESWTPYGIFLAVMTVFSLIVTGVLLLDWIDPLSGRMPSQVAIMLGWVDLFFCGLFLLDWLHSLATAERRGRYMFGERPGRSLPYGVMELFGAIPFTLFFRLLRLARLRRMGWHLADLTPRALYRAVIASRTESAVLITVLVAFLVITLGSIAVLYYEYDHPLADIDNAEDAFWWALVTITTVGYGDEVLVTSGGRAVGAVTMIVGIGIFGVIAGSLASLLTAGRSGPASPGIGIGSGRSDDAVAVELAALRAEVQELSRLLRVEREGSEPG